MQNKTAKDKSIEMYFHISMSPRQIMLNFNFKNKFELNKILSCIHLVIKQLHLMADSKS